MKRDELSSMAINLDRLSMFFDFSIIYTTEHPDLPEDFRVTDEMLEEFREFLKEKEFTFKSPLEKTFEDLEKIVDEGGKDEQFSEEFARIHELIEADKEQEFFRNTDYIKRGIKRDMLSRLYGESAVYEQIVLETDPYVLRAVEILASPSEYAGILGE